MRYHGFVDSNSTVKFIRSFQLSHHCMSNSHVSYYLINLQYISLQVLWESKYFDAVSLQCLIWKALLHFFHYGNSMHMQHFPSITRSKILVNVVSSDHTSYCIGGFCLRCHCMHVQDTMIFKKSHNLIIKRVRRYSNHRYYCWAGKLILHRKWASHTIHATQ